MRGNVILVVGAILVTGTIALTGLEFFAPVLPYASAPRPAAPTGTPVAPNKSFLLPDNYRRPPAPTVPAAAAADTAARLAALDRELDRIEASRPPAVSFKPGEPMIDPRPR